MDSEGKKLILLVEDELIIAMSKKTALEKYGYDVKTVNTGEKAVDAMNVDAAIDLILMDINLGSGIDGTQAAKLILKDHDIPIIFVSSHSEREVVEKTEKITSYGYVVKNSSITVLDASIKMAFKLFDAKVQEHAKNKELMQYKDLLTQSESQFSLFMDYLPAIVFLKDAKGRTLFTNKYMNTALGSSEWKGKTMTDVFPNVFGERLLADDMAVLEARYKKIEEVIPHVDGSIHTYETHKFAIPKSMNELLIGGVSIDITERKRMEEALRESEVKLRSIIDAAPFPIAIVDLQDNNIRFWSKSALDLFGHTADTALDWYKIAYPDQEYRQEVVSRWKPFLQNAQSNGKTTYTGEYRVTCKDGSVRVCDLYATFIADSLIVTFNDITERKKSEQELYGAKEKAENNEFRLNLAVSSGQLGIWDWDVKNNIMAWNDRMFELYGVRHDTFPNNIDAWTNGLHPEDKERAIGACYTALDGGNDFNTTFRVLHPDGKVLYLKADAKIIRDTDGKPLRMTGINRDITEEIESEKLMEKMLVEKELILKEVHHRIKNNMNTLNSLLSIQAQTVSEQSARIALEDAGARVQNMSFLYDKLYQSPSFSELSVKDYLPALIDEIIANFPNRKMVVVEKDIKDFMLDAKLLQPLGIIVNELLTNIMKYAFAGRDSGLITVSATNSGGRVVFSTQDNGVGMPESIDFGNSTGFGMILIYNLAKQLKGTIHMERGNGTKTVLEFDK